MDDYYNYFFIINYFNLKYIFKTNQWNWRIKPLEYRLIDSTSAISGADTSWWAREVGWDRHGGWTYERNTERGKFEVIGSTRISCRKGQKERGRKSVFLRKCIESIWGCQWKSKKISLDVCVCIYECYSVYVCVYQLCRYTKAENVNEEGKEAEL